MDHATQSLLTINGLRWSLKYNQINFIIHKNVATFIEYSEFKSLSDLHKDFLKVYDIFGLINSSFTKINSRKDLISTIDQKRTQLVPIIKSIYNELKNTNQQPIEFLINYRDNKTKVGAPNLKLINLLNQCIELELQGIKSISFIDAFLSFDDLILQILSDEKKVIEYRKLWMITMAFNRNPALFIETIVKIVPETNQSKSSNEIEHLMSSDKLIWTQVETQKQFEKIILADEMLSNKFIDTQGVITEIITLLEDLKLDQSDKLVNSIYQSLNKKDIEKIKNILLGISEKLIQNINLILTKYHIRFNSFISILGYLNDEDINEFNNFQLYYTLLDLLDTIGINFYLDSNGNLIINPNFEILEGYLKGYYVS